MIVIDMTSGVTKEGCDSLINILNLSSLRATNEARAAAGRPPLTDDQQIKVFGKVIQKLGPVAA